MERNLVLDSAINKDRHTVRQRNRTRHLLDIRVHEIERNLVWQRALFAPCTPQAKKKEKNEASQRRHKAPAAFLHVFTRHKAS